MLLLSCSQSSCIFPLHSGQLLVYGRSFFYIPCISHKRFWDKSWCTSICYCLVRYFHSTGFQLACNLLFITEIWLCIPFQFRSSLPYIMFSSELFLRGEARYRKVTTSRGLIGIKKSENYK